MNNTSFFKNPIGVFQGFSNSGLEFHADIMLPYRPEFQVIPMHGSFLLIELENEDEAVLGRISSLQSMGRLSGSGGSEYAIRALQRNSSIPEDIREDHLRYKVDIRVLGVLRCVDGTIVFAPSHRRLPHVGSRVAFPDEVVLKDIALDTEKFGMPIGHLALGEYIYSLGDEQSKLEPWHQIKSPVVMPRFNIKYLVSRKTFVFARAGYGKSNLNKLLFSSLYEKEQPIIEWGDGTKVPVGTLLFDPEGEYFWPDSNGRPGLADVPGLKERLMVFTDRESSSKYYSAFVAGPAKMDLARMSPSDVLNMGMPVSDDPPKWVSRLYSVDPVHWAEVVELIYGNGNSTNLDELAEALGLQPKNRGEEHWELTESQLNAARRDLTNIINRFHAPKVVTFEAIEEGLRKGMMVVFDLSQMNPSVAERVTKQIVNRIFANNQIAHTSTDEKPIPTILAIEEAQTVLGGSKLNENDPIVAWVKQGRKYHLGAVMITQQPGAISDQILSQGDNWFVFHLVSGVDLSILKRANGHFSDDILQSILNEPIKGQGYFWSSESERSYPVPVRILPFESQYNMIGESYAELDIPSNVPEIAGNLINTYYKEGCSFTESLRKEIQEAFERIKQNAGFIKKLNSGEVHKKYAAMTIRDALGNKAKYRTAESMIPKLLDAIFGAGAWDEFDGKDKKGEQTKFYKKRSNQ
jgi:hypothetical protein